MRFKAWEKKKSRCKIDEVKQNLYSHGSEWNFSCSSSWENNVSWLCQLKGRGIESNRIALRISCTQSVVSEYHFSLKGTRTSCSNIVSKFGAEMYNLCLEFLVIPESKEALKDDQSHSQRPQEPNRWGSHGTICAAIGW